MKTILVDQFLAGLCTIPEEDFSAGAVYDYMASHPVDERSLQPYFFFSKNHFTRNLIFKNHLFELRGIVGKEGKPHPSTTTTARTAGWRCH